MFVIIFVWAYIFHNEILRNDINKIFKSYYQMRTNVVLLIIHQLKLSLDSHSILIFTILLVIFESYEGHV